MENNKRINKHYEYVKDGTNAKKERNEDTTQYGEFISSFDNWTSLEAGKKIAQHLENATKDKTNKDK